MRIGERSTRALIGLAALAVVGVCAWLVVDALRVPTIEPIVALDPKPPATQATASDVLPAANVDRGPTANVPTRVVRLGIPPLRGESPHRIVVASPPDESPPAISNDVARLALDYVGVDPIAEDVWMAAINDPRLPAENRSDLIEDLNESGFADPENVRTDELPIVLARLALIERLAPQALDQTNFDAFAEAYRDLTNIATRLSPQLQLANQPGEVATNVPMQEQSVQGQLIPGQGQLMQGQGQPVQGDVPIDPTTGQPANVDPANATIAADPTQP